MPFEAGKGSIVKHRLTIVVFVALGGALVFVSPAAAQRGFGARPAPVSRAAFRGSFGTAGRGAIHPTYPIHPNSFARGRNGGWGYLGYPGYYDESNYESAGTEAVPRESDAQPTAEKPPERVPPSFVLERRGDQWVQVTGYIQSPIPAQSAQTETAKANLPQTLMPIGGETVAPPLEIPPAVLVYRDGHKEEIKSYTIIGQTLYTSANYWTSGSWTRKIDLAGLDVPVTLKLNQERGSKFTLPSGPEEVVIR
ncbi:MAG TPA: hypothetical protein VKV95_14800 [Terriglobia bacterium]|nr:hypothetical protein [Terriglobia bacterium]